MFKLPKYNHPDFNQKNFQAAQNVRVERVTKDGVSPENYHVTSMYPEYFKVNGKWILATESRMDCVVVIGDDEKLEIKEFRNLKVGDQVVIGRTEDGSEGIYLYVNGFMEENKEGDVFSFRSGRSRETAFTKDYEDLFELLQHEKENGYIVWVLGPAVSFDCNSRKSMADLIHNGYAHAVLAGNALATHDIEGAIFGTALGQDIYNQDSKPNGHYHHIDAINRARKAGSLERLVENGDVKNGIVHACVKNHVPMVLAGSIRDDGPLPSVFADVYDSQEAMRSHAKRATTVICLATQLHTIATGNVTPSYTVVDGKVRPVYIYAVDVSEFVLNKLRDRGTLQGKTIVANIQDFLGKLRDRLID